jgi:hypothetical protein|nr:MAG TPA: PolyVal ADP-Ribosyltransferase [Caudoviricetes sp.]
MSIADQIINGTYGKKNANSGIAESIINGTFEEQRRKKEEEKKRREEQMKIQTSNVVLPMNLKKETSSKIVLPMKSNNSQLNRQTLPVNTWNDLKYNLQQGTITNDKQGTRVTLQDASAMKEAEQINKDIENKNYNSSVAHILNSFPEGIKKGVTGIANSGLLPIARNAQKISDFGKKIGVLKDDNFLNESKSKILDVAEELSQKSSYRSKVNKDVNNNVVNMASNINNVIGNMVPSMVANFVTPGSGLALTGLSSGGNSAQETINEDRSNLSEAIKTGILKGAVEAGTEKLTGGNIIAKGSLDDLAGKFISEKVKSKVGKFIANKAYGFLGEMTEEQISDNAGYIIDRIINKKELPDFNEWWNNAGETNKITFLSTLALNLVGLGGGDVSKEYENKINKVMDIVEKDPEIKKQIEEIKSNQSQMSNELNNILNNKKLPMQKYQYEKSENVKIDRLRQDANRYFNNTEQAHNFVDMLEKIVTDKNIDIRLDSSLKSPDGRKANGSYSDGVITINPNSTRTGEFIAIHELTHAIGTDQMKGIIDNYRKSNMEFDTSVKQLLNNYNSTEITEEALSDVSAQLFGTQDFINNVAQNNPNIFQRIYSEIKYLWHQFRGYKNQNQFVEDLYYKWTQAYNRKNRLNDNSNYSIQADNNGNKYVQIDTDQDIFKGKSLSEQTKIAKRYILDNFREKGINLDNENIKITMKTANEYTHPKNKLPAITKESKIKASTELDNLLNVSEYQYSTEDDGRHPFAKDGWDYYKTTFEVNGLKFEGLINIAKSGNKKTLYDVTKIKRISQNYSASDKSFSVSLTNSNNSIPPSNKDVNTTKYSMQESENNSFSMQDNQGRTLTKEQQEYFKDSKVRDENGNLLEVYHGTEANSGIPKEYWFTIFDIDKSKISTMGDGFYFTDNYDRASSYAHSKGNVYKSYLNITNPFTLKNNMTFEETVKSINPNYNIDNLKMENRNKFDGTKLRKYLIDNGYDGISLSGTYVAFNSNQIKNVSNTKPTSNPDIRYSQNNETWQSYLENNFNTNGTRTNLKDIKLPMKKDLKQQNKSNSTVVNQEIAEDNISRKSIIEKNRELAKDKIKNIAKWKDKSMGLKYQRETMERNMFDIISNKQEAQDIIDTYFTPVHEAEAEKQRFINSYNDKVERLNLNQYESEAVQLLGEAKYNPDFKSDEEVVKTLKSINKNINQGKIDKAKVEKAIDTLRNIYDEILELENQVLRANGYAEIKYRTGYFPHFIDYQPVTKAEKVLDKLGIEIDKRPLPTNIAGRTEQFVPGKTWNRSSLNRKTDKTTYNALKGFDTYIRQAADTIFHTENIQRLRGLENEIRYQYSDKGIQEKIDKIYDNEILTPQEKMMEISKVFDVADNPMPNLVVELRRYTNALANKKSEADRSLENRISRSIYSTTKAIENRFGANAIGLNIGSAITNFIAITQAYSQISTKNIGRATIDTIKSYISDDGFINESTFLTNRLKQADKLYKTSLEKISDKTSFLFNAIDNVASNIIVRGKYLDNIDKGMTAKEALKNANSFGANVMADRSKGTLPTLFEEKNPISKAFTQFQLEVNNQYSYMFKDIPRDLKDKGLANIALAYFKMFVAAYLFNWTSEKITGRKSAFSPIDIAVDSFETLNTPNMNTADKLINVGTDIVQELPFIGGLAGGGRIPVSGAIPDAKNTFKAISGLATGEINSSKAVKTLLNEISKPASYLLLPFGGGQVRKTVEGVGTILAGGSYGVDSEGKETLKFPVEKANLGTYMKAGIFGKYALPEAKSYADNNYKSLNAKQTEMYKYAKLPYKQLLEYTNSKLKKKEDKIKYLQDQNWTEQQKWGIFKYDILNNTERDDGGSQLKDAEYIISTGTSKTEFMKSYDKAQKNNIDIPTEKEYKKMNERGLKFKTYIDYKVTEKNETQKRKKQGRLKENQSLKAKDKIQILLDSTYSNKEIGAIYENYIKAEKDTEYDIIVNNAKVDIKTYLKFKQQEFESDKKDDGTLNGKTVSKSKQKKVIEYLNKIHANKEITGNQSLLLYAIHGYATTSSQKKQLVNYVQSLSLKRNEKLKLFDKFSGFTVYKDGRVKYK